MGTVDQYSATPTAGKSVTYSGLTNDWHTIFINGSGTHNTAGPSLGFFMYHDAFMPNGGAPVEN